MSQHSRSAPDTNPEAVERLEAELRADTTDPSDMVLWFGEEFAGNVGARVQPVTTIFDIDAKVAVEMARRWNDFRALAAERDALSAEVEQMRAVVQSVADMDRHPAELIALARAVLPGHATSEPQDPAQPEAVTVAQAAKVLLGERETVLDSEAMSSLPTAWANLVKLNEAALRALAKTEGDG